MRKIKNPVEFYTLMQESNVGSAITPHLNAWFYTMTLKTTEEKTGIGLDNSIVFYQTWELKEIIFDQADQLNYFSFMMWGEDASIHNEFFATHQYEGKRMMISIPETINLLKNLCLIELMDPQDRGFELKNLAKCQGVESFFNLRVKFDQEALKDYKSIENRKLQLDIYLPTFFNFPSGCIENNFTKTLTLNNAGDNMMFNKKSFVGLFTFNDDKITLSNILPEFKSEGQLNCDFNIIISNYNFGGHFAYADTIKQIRFEIPIDSFQLIS